jgi:hypothetical protein
LIQESHLILDLYSDNDRKIMTAHHPVARSIFLRSRRFRLMGAADFVSSQVTERDAPLMRIEGPDIALSGRQILLKLLS